MILQEELNDICNSSDQPLVLSESSMACVVRFIKSNVCSHQAYTASIILIGGFVLCSERLTLRAPHASTYTCLTFVYRSDE